MKYFSDVTVRTLSQVDVNLRARVVSPIHGYDRDEYQDLYDVSEEVLTASMPVLNEMRERYRDKEKETRLDANDDEHHYTSRMSVFKQYEFPMDNLQVFVKSQKVVLQPKQSECDDFCVRGLRM